VLELGSRSVYPPWRAARCHRANGADGISNIEGKVARGATSKLGNERVSIDRFIAKGGKDATRNGVSRYSAGALQRSKISFDAYRRISDADLNVSFGLNLCTWIQLATLGENTAHRVEWLQMLSLPEQVDKIQHCTIQMKFNQIDVVTVSGLVYRQTCSG
jgi:hypothetical protein